MTVVNVASTSATATGSASVSATAKSGGTGRLRVAGGLAGVVGVVIAVI